MKKYRTLILSLLVANALNSSAQEEHLIGNNKLPIKPARTVAFTTTEGSNMTVDISSDGQKIVFDLLGDLYTVSSKGGVAKQITRGIAVSGKPVWNPKNNMIAYISDESGDYQLTVLDTLGAVHQRFGNRCQGSPVWDSSGNFITTSERGNNSAYCFYYLGGGEIKVPDDISQIIGFSNDQKLFFVSKSQESDGLLQIGCYERSSGSREFLTDIHKEQDQIIKNVRISKDARFLAYQIIKDTLCTLILFDLLEKKEKPLARWSFLVSSSSDSYPQFAFSSDSKKIVAGYGGKIHLIDILTGKDQIIPFIAHVLVDMGGLNIGAFKLSHDSLQVKYMRSAHTSSDDKHLVFSALGKIFIMDMPNGKPRQLVKQDFNQYQPALSPDGKSIVYVSWGDKEFGNVWKINLKEMIPTKLTQIDGVYHNPSWSPDGNSIVVVKGRTFMEGKPFLGDRDGLGLGELISINVITKKVKRIVDTVPLSNRPMFSSDGKKIIYSPIRREEYGNGTAYLVSKITDSIKNVLAIAQPKGSIASFEFFLRQILISPDERYIVYLNEENLYLLPISPSGGITLLYDQSQKIPLIRFARGGFDPHWEKGGKILSWSFGNKYYQIDPDKIVAGAISAAQERAKSGLMKPAILDINIPPDNVVLIDLKVARKVSNGMLALKNGFVITMDGNKVIKNGTVLINNGRIFAIGPTDEIKIPKGTKELDMMGKIIAPGLIDLHDHLRLPAEIFPQQKWELLADLAYGITTAREPSGSHDSFGYEELIEAGKLTAPRLFNVGFAVREDWYPNINNLDEARIVVQNRVRMGAIVVKQYSQATRLKRQLLLIACEEAGLNMTNEVVKNMPGFIGHLKDGTSGVEHNPLWGEVYDDVIQLVAKSGTYLTPTLQVAYGTQQARWSFLDRYRQTSGKLTRFYPEKEIIRRSLEKQAQVPGKKNSFITQSSIDARIRRQGGRVTMGSHGNDPALGAHFEIWALQMGGLTNLEALQSATIMAAGALGIQKDLGSIEVGKIADLLILNKNPLDNIQNTIEIQSVMKNGILYDGNTLDEIWPKKKKMVINK